MLIGVAELTGVMLTNLQLKTNLTAKDFVRKGENACTKRSLHIGLVLDYCDKIWQTLTSNSAPKALINNHQYKNENGLNYQCWIEALDRVIGILINSHELIQADPASLQLTVSKSQELIRLHQESIEKIEKTITFIKQIFETEALAKPYFVSAINDPDQKDFPSIMCTNLAEFENLVQELYQTYDRQSNPIKPKDLSEFSLIAQALDFCDAIIFSLQENAVMQSGVTLLDINFKNYNQYRRSLIKFDKFLWQQQTKDILGDSIQNETKISAGFFNWHSVILEYEDKNTIWLDQQIYHARNKILNALLKIQSCFEVREEAASKYVMG